MLIENFHVVKKGWGSEIWISNSDKYCGKILCINRYSINSWHYHKLKDETFYVESGSIKLYYGWDDDFDKAECIFLDKGQAFHIPVGLKHRMYGVEDSRVFEFSTQHFDEDSIRLIPGD